MNFIRRDSDLNALEFLPKVSLPINKIKSDKRQNNEITDIKGRANLSLVIIKITTTTTTTKATMKFSLALQASLAYAVKVNDD